jgi:hypothetical protein
MKTKKIRLSELRTLIKKTIKESEQQNLRPKGKTKNKLSDSRNLNKPQHTPTKPDNKPLVDPDTAPSEKPRRRITPKPGVRPAPKALKEKVSTKDLTNRFLNLKKKYRR